jgi:hypothetical protein
MIQIVLVYDNFMVLVDSLGPHLRASILSLPPLLSLACKWDFLVELFVLVI